MTTVDSWPKTLLFRTQRACYTKSKYSLIVSYDVMENHVIYGWNLKRSCHSDTAQTQAWNLVFFWPTNPNATSSLLAEKFLIEVQLLLQSIHTYYLGENNHMVCPSKGPNWFWTIQIILVEYQSFWMGLIFILVWVQIILDMSKV